jgi:Protein of unknown function (DUF1571)
MGAVCVVGLAWSTHGDLGGAGVPIGGDSETGEAGDGATASTLSPTRTADDRGSLVEPLMDSSESSTAASALPHLSLKPVALGGPGSPAASVRETPILRAIRMIDQCQDRYEQVRDYVCKFSKRERVDGRLTPLHVMTMKVRTRPRSIYLKFQQPAPGREAIFIVGRHGGKVLAHDVGLNKLLAGTLRLEPTGSRAMEDCRHPITEAGIGPLLDTIEDRWAAELDPTESLVAFRPEERVNGRAGTIIETTHPQRQPEFLFYQVRVFIDRDLGLPTRFEAYDWPETPGGPAALVEEYTYTDLKLNIGLSDLDFDVSNANYSFGRF